MFLRLAKILCLAEILCLAKIFTKILPIYTKSRKENTRKIIVWPKFFVSLAKILCLAKIPRLAKILRLAEIFHLAKILRLAKICQLQNSDKKIFPSDPPVQPTLRVSCH